VADGEKLTEFEFPGAIRSVAFQPQGPGVATLSSNGLVRLWNATSGAALGEPFPADGTRATQFAFTPDGGRILLGDQGGSLSCWNAKTGKRMFPLPAIQRGSIIGLASSADGRVVVASSSDGTARVWDLQDRHPLGELIRLDRHAGLLMVRPRSQQILLAAEPRSAVLFDIPAATQLGALLEQDIQAVAISPDGESVVTGSRSGNARLYKAATGQTFGKAMSHARVVQQVAFRRDSTVVLTGSDDGTARLWDAANGEPRLTLPHRVPLGPTAQVKAAVFSPDGRVVATGDNLGIVRIWNSETGALIHSFEKVDGAANSISFSEVRY